MTILMIQIHIFFFPHQKVSNLFFYGNAYIAQRVEYPFIILLRKKKKPFDSTVRRLITLRVNVLV